METEESISVPDTAIILCLICDKPFKTISSRNKHIKAVHKQDTEYLGTRRKIVCSLCQQGCRSKQEYEKHLLDLHQLSLEYEEKEFETVEAFLEYKTSIEKETHAKYLKNKESIGAVGKNIKVFYCHRAGFKRKRGRGIRKERLLGTNKIDAYCPAQMKLTYDGLSYKMKFCKTHLGHANEIRKTRNQKKAEKAAKVEQNISLEIILDDIRNSTTTDLQSGGIDNHNIIEYNMCNQINPVYEFIQQDVPTVEIISSHDDYDLSSGSFSELPLENIMAEGNSEKAELDNHNTSVESKNCISELVQEVELLKESLNMKIDNIVQSSDESLLNAMKHILQNALSSTHTQTDIKNVTEHLSVPKKQGLVSTKEKKSPMKNELLSVPSANKEQQIACFVLVQNLNVE